MLISSDSFLFRYEIDKVAASLKKVLKTGYPINPRLKPIHERRLFNADTFMSELKELNWFFRGMDLNVELVRSGQVLKSKLGKTDIAITEYEGKFCKIILTWTFPSKEANYIVYIKGLKHL